MMRPAQKMTNRGGCTNLLLVATPMKLLLPIHGTAKPAKRHRIEAQAQTGTITARHHLLMVTNVQHLLTTHKTNNRFNVPHRLTCRPLQKIGLGLLVLKVHRNIIIHLEKAPKAFPPILTVILATKRMIHTNTQDITSLTEG